MNYWDVLENNIDRTIKWFTNQDPIHPQDKIQKLLRGEMIGEPRKKIDTTYTQKDKEIN